MKSTLVRLSVLALSITGFAASTMTSAAAPKKLVVKPQVMRGVVGTCLPSSGCNGGMKD